MAVKHIEHIDSKIYNISNLNDRLEWNKIFSKLCSLNEYSSFTLIQKMSSIFS